MRWINISPTFVRSYQAIREKNKALNNAIIEPQSKTELILPYLLHLKSLVHMKNKKGRGRRK